MKKFLFLLSISIAIISCKKNDLPDTSGPKSPFPTTSILNLPSSVLIGKWEMVFFQTYDHSQKYQTGQGHILQLNADKTYTRLSNYQQTSGGTYYTVKNGVLASNIRFDAIYFSDYRDGASIISGNADTLVIKTGPNSTNEYMLMDGGTTVYVKQK